MASTTVTLSSPEQRNGTSARGAWTLSLFPASDGRKYQTFDGAIASVVASLIGQPAVVEYEEEQRNGNTNYVIKAASAATAGTVVQTAPAAAVVAHPAAAPSSKDEQIARAVALKQAFDAFAVAGQDPILSRNEVVEFAGTLVPFLLTGVDTPAE
jgi:hypothetical protein